MVTSQLRGRLRIASLILLGGLAATSFVTSPTKSAPGGGPLLEGAKVDEKVLAILQRSCRDCHSDVTYYPWYSYVAPFSLLIRSDVSGGRLHLNLSRWNEISLQRKERSLSEIANQVRDRDMPLWQYTLIHRAARLSDAEVDIVFRWTQTERARLISENSPGAR